MHSTKLTAAAALVLAATLSGCTATTGNDAAVVSAPSSTPSAASASADSSGQHVDGTVVRFAAGTQSVEVTMGEDTPATRDFLGMLPLTLTLEEFNGREKIADLPRALIYQGSPGSDPEDGDLIYYTPWGNIGFYYNTTGVGYSDQTLHLGTYHATAEELERLEGQQVTVEIAN